MLDRPTEGQPKETYRDEQGFERFTDLMSNAKVRDRHTRTLREIRPLMTDSSVPARLFDVGAGSGEFLNQAREVGFEVYGNELSDAAIRLACQRYDVVLSSASLEQEGRGDFFDVILMRGLLEHVLQPLSVLKDAFRVLRHAGIAYIHTPA